MTGRRSEVYVASRVGGASFLWTRAIFQARLNCRMVSQNNDVRATYDIHHPEHWSSNLALQPDCAYAPRLRTE